MKGLVAALLIIWLGVCRAFAGPVVKIGRDVIVSEVGTRAVKTATVTPSRATPSRATSSKLEKLDAQAAVEIHDTMSSFFNDTINAIAPFDPACFYCKTDAGEATVAPTCSATYSNLYSKPVVDFRVTLGYADKGFEVQDAPSRAAWVDKLLLPCQKDQVGTCGFKRDSDDADLFSKSVDGPDGKSHLVRLRMVNSSAGVDDDKNRGALKPLQDAQTKRAEENFYGGLGGADVVIYVAHARKGGGASFSPPVRGTSYGAVDYKAYADHKNEDRVLEILRSNGQPPKLIGIFACDASKLFAGDVRAASHGKSGVASSTGMTPPEVAMAQAFAALDSLLAERCQREFVGSLRAVRKWSHEVAEPPTLIGFFGDAPALSASPAVTANPGENAIVPLKDRSGSSTDITSRPLIRPPSYVDPLAPLAPAISKPSGRSRSTK